MSTVEAILLGLALTAAVAALVRRAWRLFSGSGGCCGGGCASLREKPAGRARRPGF